MHCRSEKKVFKEIMSYTPQYLKTIFSVNTEDTIHTFIEKKYPDHYVTVRNQINPEPSIASVNADFGFKRPAGSNNYPELIEVGKYLMDAFQLLPEE